MNNSYDSNLTEIPFYKIHPEYLPFIGDHYDQYKVLHIGESHYIDQKWNPEVNDEVTILDFFNWFEDPCLPVSEKFHWWYNTRDVVYNYLNGKRHKGHQIFTNLTKSFDKIVLQKEMGKATTESCMDYNYFAFMNFYQMPSIYNGISYWSSLEKSAQKLNRLLYANQIYEVTAKKSSQIVDEVIDIIKPEMIIFTSQSAFKAYAKFGKYAKEDFVIYTVHPGCAWWNRPLKRFQGLTGKEKLEQEMMKHFSSI